MKVKRIVISTICLAAVCGGSWGGWTYYQQKQDRQRVVKVAPVVNMMGYNFNEGIMIDGMVVNGSTQKIRPSQNKVVQKVLVSVGDQVSVGTPLLQYDTRALELEVQEKANAVAIAEDKIRMAKKELLRLQGLHSAEEWIEPIPEEEFYEEPFYEEEPIEDPEPETETDTETETDPESMRISSLEAALEGDGSAEAPYLFSCKEESVLTAELLSALRESGAKATCLIAEPYAWLIDGTRLPEDLTDWEIGQAAKIGEDGSLLIDFQQTLYGSFYIAGAEIPEQDSEEELPPEEDFFWEDAYDEMPFWEDSIDPDAEETDDYRYTAKELAQMIQKQQSEIKTLEFDKKTADLAYEAVLKKKDSGQECSLIAGVVTEINTDLTEQETDKAYMVIQGSSGLQVQGSISEANLKKLQPGTSITGMSWETGDSMELTVRTIEETPASDSYIPYNENPNNSMYHFLAESEATYDIPVGTWISLSCNDDSSVDDSIYLPMQYVREENGQYYVMKENASGRLEQQWVETGKIVYSTIEIKSGVTQEDYLCFPYGKNVKEGVRTKRTEEVVW